MSFPRPLTSAEHYNSYEITAPDGTVFKRRMKRGGNYAVLRFKAGSWTVDSLWHYSHEASRRRDSLVTWFNNTDQLFHIVDVVRK